MAAAEIIFPDGRSCYGAVKVVPRKGEEVLDAEGQRYIVDRVQWYPRILKDDPSTMDGLNVEVVLREVSDAPR